METKLKRTKFKYILRFDKKHDNNSSHNFSQME